MAQIKERLRQTLRRIEQHTQTDMVYLAQGSFWTTLRFVVGLVASLGTMIAFGNLVPKETYGTYSYLLSLAGSLGFLTLTGMSTGIIRAVARGQEAVIPYAVKLQLRYNLLSTFAIGIAALYYVIKGNSVFAISLGILAISLPLTATFHTFESILIGRKRFDILTSLTTVSTLGAALATILTLLLTDNVIIIISVYAIMSLFPNLWIYSLVRKSVKDEAPSEAAISELRQTSFHLTWAGIISTLSQYIDKIILFQVAGPASLAVYGFAIAGPERLKGLVKGWSSIALPRLAEKSVTEIRSLFYKRIGFSLMAGVGLSIIYILLAPLLFKLFLPLYLDAIPYSQVYALGIIVIPALVYTGAAFYGLNMLRAVYISSVGGQIIRILLFLALGWLWQTWGLIIASLISYLVNTIYSIMIWEIESRGMIKRNKPHE